MVKRKTTEEFIQQAIALHGYKYNYSLVEYKHCESKVTIICPVHGSFSQSPRSHLQGKGQGCIKCGGREKKTTKSFVQQAIAIYGDTYDYSLVEYVNDKTKIKIACRTHGIFEQLPNNHLRVGGCAKCGADRRGFKCRTTKSSFVEQARFIHGNTYGYSLVEYVNARTAVSIICPKHNLFSQTPETHLKGSGCPNCAEYGFNPSKSAIIYLLKFQTDIASFWKIGITNRTVQERFRIDDTSRIVAGYQWECEGSKAREIEQEILRKYRRYQLNCLFPLLSYGGDTECFNLNLPHRKIIKEITAKLETQHQKVHIGLSDSLKSLIS